MTDILPQAAQSKLLQLAGQADDAGEAARSAVRRIGDLRGELTEATSAKAAALEHKIARLQIVRDDQQRRHQNLSTLVSSLKQWLSQVPPGTSLEMARVKLTKMKDGETIPQAIGRLRQDTLRVRDELRVAQAAPLPKADLKEQAWKAVLKLAAEGQPKISAAGKELKVDFSGSGFGVSSHRIACIAAWMNPDAMHAALQADIDALPEHQGAMSAQEKVTKVAKLTADLDSLERSEEALIEQAASDGMEILRRPTASAPAVLGVVVKVKEFKAA